MPTLLISPEIRGGTLKASQHELKFNSYLVFNRHWVTLAKEVLEVFKVKILVHLFLTKTHP